MKDPIVSLVSQRFIHFLWMVFMLFAFAKAVGQERSATNVSAESFQNADFEVVDIYLDRHLQLSISTTSENKVDAQTSQTGEYRDAVVLSTKIVGNQLKITDPINPSFHFPQDKLSAHKVIDGIAEISIPENKILVINARSCDLRISGKFKNVYINLESGSCTIDHLSGDLKVVSVYGDIYGKLEHYDIEARSRTGLITIPEKPTNFIYTALLETLSGNIRILKTPE